MVLNPRICLYISITVYVYCPCRQALGQSTFKTLALPYAALRCLAKLWFDQAMSQANITFRLEAEPRAALDALAMAMDCDRRYRLNEAVQLDLALHQWQLEASS